MVIGVTGPDPAHETPLISDNRTLERWNVELWN